MSASKNTQPSANLAWDPDMSSLAATCLLAGLAGLCGYIVFFRGSHMAALLEVKCLLVD
jgi:hypothetical protein